MVGAGTLPLLPGLHDVNSAQPRPLSHDGVKPLKLGTKEIFVVSPVCCLVSRGGRSEQTLSSWTLHSVTKTDDKQTSPKSTVPGCAGGVSPLQEGARERVLRR